MWELYDGVWVCLQQVWLLFFWSFVIYFLYAIDVWRTASSRLPYTEYCPIIWMIRNFEWQREWENSTSQIHYIKLCIEEWESAHNSCRKYKVKLSRLCFGHSGLIHGHLLSRNDQQPACRNVKSENQRLASKYYFQKCLQ